jgi:subtilisin-like proprotein convertase family protein
MTTKQTVAAIAALFAVASCTQGPTGPSGVDASAGKPGASTSVALGSGDVGASAVGDVQNGPIEILRVRVHQGGGLVRGFYAMPGGAYNVLPDQPVEFWVEWVSSRALADVPRLDIAYGDGFSDNIHCGPCRLTRSYRTGTYTVTIKMDDRVGGVTTRTFTIDARTPANNVGTFVFSNTTSMNVPVSGSSGPASLYPSPIAVSGVDGAVSKVSVSINSFTHTFWGDIELILVSPDNKVIVLTDDNGSGFDPSGTYVFDDSAATSASSISVAGSYSPFTMDNIDATGIPSPATGTLLAHFNGSAPNGTWRLFVFDQYGGDSGVIAGGWTLTITTQ